MENRDFARGFANVVVDDKWTVYQLTNRTSFSKQSTKVRKSCQQLNVFH